jgi:hypothetical protein
MMQMAEQRTCQVTNGRKVSHSTRKRDVCLQEPKAASSLLELRRTTGGKYGTAAAI